MIRGAIFIVCNSWNSSLQAYGISTYAKFVLLSHVLQQWIPILSLYAAIIPQSRHTCTWYLSEASYKRPRVNLAAPCETMQLCATTPFARNECVSSTLISYTCFGPTGILDTIVKFIVGIESQPRVTPYFASSSLPETESSLDASASTSTSTSSKSGRHLPPPIPLSSFLNQSSAPIVSRNCSAVGNPFAVNLPNSVPLI